MKAYPTFPQSILLILITAIFMQLAATRVHAQERLLYGMSFNGDLIAVNPAGSNAASRVVFKRARLTDRSTNLTFARCTALVYYGGWFYTYCTKQNQSGSYAGSIVRFHHDPGDEVVVGDMTTHIQALVTDDNGDVWATGGNPNGIPAPFLARINLTTLQLSSMVSPSPAVNTSGDNYLLSPIFQDNGKVWISTTSKSFEFTSLTTGTWQYDCDFGAGVNECWWTLGTAAAKEGVGKPIWMLTGGTTGGSTVIRLHQVSPPSCTFCQGDITRTLIWQENGYTGNIGDSITGNTFGPSAPRCSWKQVADDVFACL